MIKLLRENKGDLYIKNDYMKTPMDFADEKIKNLIHLSFGKSFQYRHLDVFFLYLVKKCKI
jgi:hypothetical protein